MEFNFTQIRQGRGIIDITKKQNLMAKDGSSKPLTYGKYEIFISYFEN
jgi:nucleoside-triphosphatase THEP1